ncbi:hypothetical protein AGMMS49525_11420 [Bacteroidia bacterium]|nr:hypothetical protein AGMMS49525_11420 [Bacteroidia bacterium]
MFAEEPPQLQSLTPQEKFQSDYLFLESLLLKYQDNYEGAFEALQLSLAIDSTSAAAWYELALNYLLFKENDMAFAALENAYYYQPDNHYYKSELAEMSYERQEIDQAITLYEELARDYPDKQEYAYYFHRLKAADLLSQGETEEAKTHYIRLIKNDPDDIFAWMQLLQIALKQDDSREVYAVCDSALMQFPEVSEFYFYKGISCMIENRAKEALQVFTTGLAIIDENERVEKSSFLEQIADLYYRQGKKKKAFEAFEQSLENNPYNISALNNYAYYLSLLKEDLDKAERMAAEVIRQQPNNATYLDTYAWVLFQKGNYNLAKFYIESAISKSREPSAELLEHHKAILKAIEKK